MKPTRIACVLALVVASSAQGQLLAPARVAPPWTPTPAPLLKLTPSLRAHAGSEGLPPADPQAPDIYRADPKLFAGVDFTPRFGIEATFTNPGYLEGLHYMGQGPRQAKAIPMADGGYDLNVVGRARVPVTDRLSAFGTLGVARSVDRHHDGTSTQVGPAASVGATYKLNSKNSATAEVPLGAIERQRISGASNGYGARLKLGF